MHKILETMLNEPLEIGEIFQKYGELLDEPILHATKKLVSAKPKDFTMPIQDAELKGAIEFHFEESSCKEFSIIFLLLLKDRFRGVLNEKRENVYLYKAVELVDPNTHPSIATLAYFLFAADCSQNGLKETANIYYAKAKEFSPLQYFFDFKAYINFFLMSLAFEGKLKIELDDLNQIFALLKKSNLSENKKEYINDLVNDLLFIDSVARGDIEESRENIKKVKVYSPRNQRFMMYMYIQRGVYDPRNWDFVDLYNKPENVPIWAQIDIALLKRDAKLALDLSKEMMSLATNLIIANIPLFIIKSELANQNVHAAEWLLKKDSGLDRDSSEFHFFSCCLELLKKNREKAAKHFIQAFNICKYYGKTGFLKHQVDMSPQLTAEEIAFLYTKAAMVTEEYKEEDASISPSTTSTDKIIGVSTATEEVKASIKNYANLSAPVLIIGETGSGKELVASELHHQSSRSSKPYITINCSAIPDTLLQSELFGHVAGAYTSADKSRKGIFESAGHGTVFLDEFGDISPLLQVSLLRVMETMEVRAIGSNENKKIHCRFIIATNANLEELVANNKFRKDLYYRIKQLEIRILPLRDRKEDILFLAHYFLNKDRVNAIATMSKKLEEKLLAHAWDGNVRELKHEVERARLLNSDKLRYEYDDMITDKKNVKESLEIEKPKPVKSADTIAEKNPDEKKDTDIFQKDLEAVLQMQNARKSSETRLSRIMNIFQNVEKVYRQEIAKTLGVTPRTISTDFKQLLDEGVIIKVEPTSSLRSHYFTLKKIKADHLKK